MDIEILPAGPLQTNSYLVMNKKEAAALAIDAGPESYRLIMQEAQRNGVTLQGLLITHPHWDHILDVHLFAEAGIPVYAHRDAREFLENPALQESMATPGTVFHPGRMDKILTHGEQLVLAGMEVEVREAPGHCPGSVLLNFPEGGCCFTGDVIFDGSVGRTDFPGGDMAALTQSILTQVYTLPDETIIYPGHGSSSLVGKEKISNPFVTV